MRSLCLLIAVLTIAGCATSTPLLTPPTKPQLDVKLAEQCAELSKPEAADYDAWLAWMRDVVLKAYGDCAAKHRATVKAWPE